MGKQIICSSCLSNVDASAQACPYCGQSFENTNPAGTLPVNTLLAERYTVGKVLLLDGEGVLYAAVDAQTMHRVVVKEYVPITICAARARDGSVIPKPGREVLFKTTRMDFVDLYRSLVALGRTNGLTPVLDLFEANNTAYAVREPDEGIPLYSYMEQRGRPFTVEEAVRLLRPVVAGVEAMHRMGLLHRGISPETVFVGRSGEAYLSGYATLGLRTADSELKSQMFDGYAAPEQYSVSEFDGKYTDIYGLGALLYRMLTGREPVPSNLRRMNDTLPAAHVVQPEVPGFASQAIARAMRLAPGERMQAASELLAALSAQEAPERAREEEEEREDEAGGMHMTPRQTRMLILGIVALVLVAAISIWVILASGRKRQEGADDALDSSVSESLPDSSSAPESGTDSSSDTSSESSSDSKTETFTVPSFLGKKYVDVAKDPAYIQYVRFLAEHEFSTEFKEGEIIRQSHPAGTQVAVNTVITLVVSDGPETAVMPSVVGRPVEEVKAELTRLRIQFQTLQYINDGRFKEGDVANASVQSGEVVEIGTQTVLLYVAGPAPESEPEPDSSSTGEPPVVDPDSGANTEPTPPDGGDGAGITEGDGAAG